MSRGSKPGDTQGRAYHHGDLRNALIVAAAELIEEKGADGFAMVDAARRAGVSSAAPYRHFQDRDELLDAVTHLGLWALSAQAAEVSLQHPAGSIDRIVALGESYIRFVIGKPAFFDMMWGDRSARVMDETKARNPTNGFWIMVSAVGEWCEAEQLHNSDPLDLALKLWAMAIGLCGLSINRQLERFADDVDIYQLQRTSTHAFLQGVKAGR